VTSFRRQRGHLHRRWSAIAVRAMRPRLRRTMTDARFNRSAYRSAIERDDLLDPVAGVCSVSGARGRERIALDGDADQINNGELLRDPLIGKAHVRTGHHDLAATCQSRPTCAEQNGGLKLRA
jgi:hypothetical protein